MMGYSNVGGAGGYGCNGFALLVVLFILLIIVGTHFSNKGYY
ncbi:YjcZ family sporulation protein [Lysinibacillus composti]